jgi:hypothetical protein
MTLMKHFCNTVLDMSCLYKIQCEQNKHLDKNIIGKFLIFLTLTSFRSTHTGTIFLHHPVNSISVPTNAHNLNMHDQFKFPH